MKHILSRPWHSLRDFIARAHVYISRTGEIPKRWRWLLLAVVIIAVFGISYAILRFSAHLDFLENYGYLGAFLTSLITTTSIIFPIPGFVIIAAIAASTANWPLVALAAALGNGVGECTSYIAGYGGSAIVNPQNVPRQTPGRRDTGTTEFLHPTGAGCTSAGSIPGRRRWR